jgi:6-phosphogluconolactonase
MSPLSWLALGLITTLGGVATGRAERYLVYLGTYTGPKSEGIHVVRFDSETGEAGAPELAAKSTNPTFLAIHPDGRHLYAANETGRWQGRPGGYVTGFTIDRETGKLTELNEESTVGGGPCHLVVSPDGKTVLAANYGGGSVVALPLKQDGSIAPRSAFIQHAGSGPNPSHQKEPHAHSINLSPDGRFALAADLGTDRISIYGFDPGEGSLKPHAEVALPPGSGPRHLAFSPDGKRVFVINELLSTLASFSWDPTGGTMTPTDSKPTLPEGFTGNSTTAEVVVHPGGRFVYGSNRGHDSVAVFRVDDKGHLALVEHVPTGGKTPRNFALDPSGRFLWAANQDSDTVVLFGVDAATGRLKPTGQVLKIGSPVCIRFVPLK